MHLCSELSEADFYEISCIYDHNSPSKSGKNQDQATHIGAVQDRAPQKGYNQDQATAIGDDHDQIGAIGFDHNRTTKIIDD